MRLKDSVAANVPRVQFMLIRGRSIECIVVISIVALAGVIDGDDLLTRSPLERPPCEITGRPHEGRWFCHSLRWSHGVTCHGVTCKGAIARHSWLLALEATQRRTFEGL